MKREGKTIVIEIDEHYSSMGTSHIYEIAGHDHRYGSLCLGDMGFRVQRGDRFQVTVETLPPAPGKRPQKNPFLLPQRRRQK